MLAGDFAHRLRRLNRYLRIACGSDNSKPAGVYFYKDSGVPQDICGIPKNWISEFTEHDAYGHISRGGWARVLHILVSLKLIDRFESYKSFGRWDEHRTPTWSVEKKQLDRDIEEAQRKGYWKPDEIVDIGREINKAKATTVSEPVRGRVL